MEITTEAEGSKYKRIPSDSEKEKRWLVTCFQFWFDLLEENGEVSWLDGAKKKLKALRTELSQ